MENYVTRRYPIGEGLGGMIGDFAGIYVFSRLSGLTPSYLIDDDYSTFNFFNLI